MQAPLFVFAGSFAGILYAGSFPTDAASGTQLLSLITGWASALRVM